MFSKKKYKNKRKHIPKIPHERRECWNFIKMKKIKDLQKQFKDLNATQQKFVKYVIVIKIAVLIVGISILALAWWILFK